VGLNSLKSLNLTNVYPNNNNNKNNKKKKNNKVKSKPLELFELAGKNYIILVANGKKWHFLLAKINLTITFAHNFYLFKLLTF
jgi:hypothetical protein